MYEWVNGRPALLVRKAELALWPGAAKTSPPIPFGLGEDFLVSLHDHVGASVLVAGRPGALTTAVPLELGGVLLVSATYCDDDESVSHHLDFVPLSGWKTHARAFVSTEGEYVLCDGSQLGLDLVDPQRMATIARTAGGLVTVHLLGGAYEVETLGPWHPDDRTELYLTRMVRETASGITPLDDLDDDR